MSWIRKILPAIRTGRKKGRSSVPEGVWTKCEQCNAVLYRADLERNLQVCMKCLHHMPIAARTRLLSFLDAGSVREIGSEVVPVDVLKFQDKKRYRDRLQAAQKATGEKDALVALSGTLKGRKLTTCAFEFAFMGGSMGAGVGERFVRAVESALAEHTPLVCFSSSGGARMQEALFSLMQMAKTSAAVARIKQSRLPYLSVFTHPTMGGVSASLASLGDIHIAEPSALIGFAGPRVIQQTVRETLPEGFQRSEFLLEHGGLDLIIDRRHMRDRLASILSILCQ